MIRGATKTPFLDVSDSKTRVDRLGEHSENDKGYIIELITR